MEKEEKIWKMESRKLSYEVERDEGVILDKIKIGRRRSALAEGETVGEDDAI